MVFHKVIYTNGLLKFVDIDGILIDDKMVCNLFNWNSLYKVNYLGDGHFEILDRIHDTPELIEGEEYILCYQ